MIVGVPKEIKEEEYRISLTPAGVEALKGGGHEVLVEKNAGAGTGISDEEMVRAGARIVPMHEGIFKEAEMIVKVKEPLRSEYHLLGEDKILFTYLHLAADKALTEALLAAKVIGIAYETMQEDDGRIPLLTPMSEVAGRLGVQEGAKYLERCYGGEGILLGGVPGVPPAKVVILGGGVTGTNAAKMAAGLGARVLILTRNLERLRYLNDVMPANVETMKSNSYNIAKEIKDADLVVGAVLIAGGRTPILITRKMLKTMKPGSVIVDIAIDQGGCTETSHPTYHSNPIYEVDGVIHYCVANMPGSVPRTSTYALTNATLPSVLTLADLGFPRALLEEELLKRGLNVANGKITCQEVAEAHHLPYSPVSEVVRP